MRLLWPLAMKQEPVMEEEEEGEEAEATVTGAATAAAGTARVAIELRWESQSTACQPIWTWMRFCERCTPQMPRACRVGVECAKEWGIRGREPVPTSGRGMWEDATSTIL